MGARCRGRSGVHAAFEAGLWGSHYPAIRAGLAARMERGRAAFYAFRADVQHAPAMTRDPAW
jgi:hypothetical protein